MNSFFTVNNYKYINIRIIIMTEIDNKYLRVPASNYEWEDRLLSCSVHVFVCVAKEVPQGKWTKLIFIGSNFFIEYIYYKNVRNTRGSAYKSQPISYNVLALSRFEL